jgi:hypothetical protein
MAFCTAFEALLQDLNENGSLSDRTLPPVQASVLFENFKHIWSEAPQNPAFSTLLTEVKHVLSTSDFDDAECISKAIRDLQPGEHFAGSLDGPAIAVVVAAVYIMEVYPNTLRAQTLCKQLPHDEVEVILSSTDHLAFDGDPTAVQHAFHIFLLAQQSNTILIPDFCIAMYPVYVDFFKTISEFLLFIDDIAALASYAHPAVENLLKTIPIETPIVFTAPEALHVPPADPHADTEAIPQRLVTVDRSTSPIRELFYNVAETPFAHFDSPPLPPAPSPSSSSFATTTVAQSLASSSAPSSSLLPPVPLSSSTMSASPSFPPPPKTTSSASSDFDLEAALLSELKIAAEKPSSTASRGGNTSSRSADDELLRALDLL